MGGAAEHAACTAPRSELAPELLAWWVATLALAVVATVVATLVADPAAPRATSRDARRRDR